MSTQPFTGTGEGTIYLAKNDDEHGCKCCGEVFPYVTKDHVPVGSDDPEDHIVGTPVEAPEGVEWGWPAWRREARVTTEEFDIVPDGATDPLDGLRGMV